MKQFLIAAILACAAVLTPLNAQPVPDAAAKASRAAAGATATVSKGNVSVSVKCGHRGASQKSKSSASVNCRR